MREMESRRKGGGGGWGEIMNGGAYNSPLQDMLHVPTSKSSHSMAASSVYHKHTHTLRYNGWMDDSLRLTHTGKLLTIHLLNSFKHCS